MASTNKPSVLWTITHHLKSHVGVGIVIATSYFDPGNWSVDLQAGSLFGYRPMLFVLLMAGIGAMILQSLACKLGCVTGLDLAAHCRILLHNHPTHPKLVRRLCLYPLYVLAEVAIIATDLAELLGSAIGFCLIFPSLPLWAGVVVTAFDVFVFLILSDPTSSRGRPAKAFEWIIIVLVIVVMICFIILLVRVKPHWPQVFMGFIPSKGLFQSKPDAVYTAVGILGATVMPHALFLGSFLGTQDRLSLRPLDPALAPVPAQNTNYKARMRALMKRVLKSDRNDTPKDSRSYGVRDNNSLAFIGAHLRHAIADIVVSLLTLAVPINSAILVVAATVFYGRNDDIPAGLFEAHALIKQDIGSAPAFLFALALICSGQTAGVAATLAGQIVSEGFIDWKITPFLRRILTRSISLVPSVVVAVAVGRQGLHTLLVASQVILSVVLPFIALPLIYLTSSSAVMSARQPTSTSQPEEKHAASAPRTRVVSEETSAPTLAQQTVSLHDQPEEEPTAMEDAASSVESSTLDRATVVDYSNGKALAAIAYGIGLVMLTANVYAIVMLGLGRAGA